MIGNKMRPYLYGPVTLVNLIALKLFCNVSGWSYFIPDFGAFRFDGGKLVMRGRIWLERGVLVHCCGGVVDIGERTFINRGSMLVCKKSITLGKNVLIGDHVSIYDHDHVAEKKGVPIANQGYDADAVVIKDYAWIGSHVVVTKGVTIGENSVVAAGAVVTKSIPDNEVWGGVPARKIKTVGNDERAKHEKNY